MKPFTLPTTPTGPAMLEPLNLCLYGPPGIGKTPICATLPDCGYVDCQQGAIYYTARSANIVKLAEDVDAPLYEVFEEACRQFRAARVKFLVVDTIGDVADWADAKANDRFKNSPIGKAWQYKDDDGRVISKGFNEPSILDLPGVKGSAGFGKMWEAFQELLNCCMGANHRAIFVGHPKDKIAFAVGADPNVKQDTLVNSEDLDLTGKMRRIFTSKIAAIGYMQRDWEGKRINVYFQSRDSFARTRCPHLDGARLWFSNPCTLAEWARIYPNTLSEYLAPEDKVALADLMTRYGGTAAGPATATGGAQ